MNVGEVVILFPVSLEEAAHSMISLVLEEIKEAKER